MTKPDLLIAQTGDVPKDRFFVANSRNKINEGETLYPENFEVRFAGGQSLAEILFGWGIVKMLVQTGKQAVLLFRPEQEYKLPGGVNLEDE